MIEYSYDLYNELGRIVGGKLTDVTYNVLINRKDIELVDEWITKYEESTLYAKRYKVKAKNNNYMLFVWKEVK